MLSQNLIIQIRILSPEAKHRCSRAKTQRRSVINQRALQHMLTLLLRTRLNQKNDREDLIPREQYSPVTRL